MMKKHQEQNRKSSKHGKWTEKRQTSSTLRNHHRNIIELKNEPIRTNNCPLQYTHPQEETYLRELYISNSALLICTQNSTHRTQLVLFRVSTITKWNNSIIEVLLSKLIFFTISSRTK